MVSPETKQVVYAILPKVTGLMSMIGSGMIVYDVLFNPRRRKKTYHRLMCGLSISDLFSSLVLVLSTWVIPKETKGVYGNVGTPATCEAFGMIGQTSGITTPFYNFSLCCYYFMVIYRNMPERDIAPYEPWLHVLPVTIGLSTGIAGIPLTLYNPAGFICWIAEDPPGCDRDSNVSCNRGSLAWLFRWLFFYGWIWSIFFFITTIMFLIYNKVRIQEKASNRHRVKGQKKCRKRSRRVANQALQYVCAYYITFFFGTLTRILQVAQDNKTYFPIVVLFAIFFPLQGAFNALIYFYSRRGWEGSNISLSAASMAGASLRSIIIKPFARRKGDQNNRRSQKPTLANSEVMLNNTSGVGSKRAITDLVDNEIGAMFQIPLAELEPEVIEQDDDSQHDDDGVDQNDSQHDHDDDDRDYESP